MNKLNSIEKKLAGKWVNINGNIEGDEISQRIEYLVHNCLKQISYSDDGWETLFQDKKDGRYWERSYPQGEMHGGGPASLTNISEEEARKKYKF